VWKLLVFDYCSQGLFVVRSMRFGVLCGQCVFIVFSNDFVNFSVFYGLLCFVTFLEHGLFKSIVFSNGFVYVFLNMCVSPTGPLGPRWVVVVVVVVVVIIIVIVVVLLSILICYHYHYYCYY